GKWIPLALLLGSTGCAPIHHALHYGFPGRQLSELRWSYYHSPHTGRIVPKPHAVVCPEPACFGYEATCWQAWPEFCVGCPPPAATMDIQMEVLAEPAQQ